MRNIWFTIIGFLAGVTVVAFLIRPELAKPELWLPWIQNFLNNLYLLQPKQYVLIILSLAIGLLVILSLFITLIIWLFVLRRRRFTLEDEVFDLRSQLGDLLRLKG